MTPETTQYLLTLTTERRDQCGAFFYNSAHLSSEAREHWRRELQAAENALAELSQQPIK